MNTDAPQEFRLGAILPEETVRRWLAACGEAPRVYAGCRLVHADRVRLGHHVQIDEGVAIFGGDGVNIGSYVHFAYASSITGSGRCDIGDFAGIGVGVRLVTGTELIDKGGMTNPTVPVELRTVHRGHIDIGAHAVIFTNSVVLPDVRIGEGAVVAANSVVHHHLKPWGIYAGNPLVQVGVRESEAILRHGRELKRSRSSDQ